MFHVFAALAEFIRELIGEGTHEGLTAAKARGNKLGRPPAMTPDQVRLARDLLDNPAENVFSIARLLGVSRSTIYKYVPELAGGSTRALSAGPEPTPVRAVLQLPMPQSPKTLRCPTCGYRPTDTRELQLHRDGLETVWLLTEPDQPGQLVERWHCEHCQPHQAQIVMCGQADTTVMVGGALAAEDEGRPFQVPPLAAQWLTDHGWIQRSSTTWYCGNHAARTPLQ